MKQLKCSMKMEKDTRFKVLVTGCNGFIGSNLVDRLLAEGKYNVIGIDNLAYSKKDKISDDITFHKIDIRDRDIYPLFEGVDYVFHLSAKNCLADCQADPVETADINITGSINVFEASRRAKVKKVIYAESSGMYEGLNIFPTPETKVSPQSFYSISKACEMHFARAYTEYFGLAFTALRYFNVYGIGQDYRRSNPPMFSAFIMKLLRGEQPMIWGDGEKRRDFIFVDDINDFHLQCMGDSRTDMETFNLGTGVSYSVNEIYEIIRSLMHVDIKPIYNAANSWEAQKTLADITKATALGWKPKTSLQEGLRKTIQWYRENRK